MGVPVAELDATLEGRVLGKLAEWCETVSPNESWKHKKGCSTGIPDVSRDQGRAYESVENLTTLVHESAPEYNDRLKNETNLAQKIASDGSYAAAMNNLLAGVAGLGLTAEQLGEIAKNSRYRLSAN